MENQGILRTIFIIICKLANNALCADPVPKDDRKLPPHLVPKKFDLDDVLRIRERIHKHPHNLLTQTFSTNIEDAGLILKKYKELVDLAVKNKDCEYIIKQISDRFGHNNIGTEQDLIDFLRLGCLFQGNDDFWELARELNDRNSEIISSDDLYDIFYTLVYGYFDWETLRDKYWYVIHPRPNGVPVYYFIERIAPFIWKAY